MSKVVKVSFDEFMRAGHIQRWHVVNTVKTQSVAEHAYMVTVIAMELFQRVVGFDDPAEVNLLMAGALFHDAPEIRYGDIPTPGKRFIRERVGQDFFADMDRDLMPEIPYVGGTIPERLIPFIRIADAIEAYSWISANKAGAQADMVARTCAAHLQNLVIHYTENDGQDWFEPVNAVLMALHLPYISKNARVTPL